jgi:hypothetical protein
MFISVWNIDSRTLANPRIVFLCCGKSWMEQFNFCLFWGRRNVTRKFYDAVARHNISSYKSTIQRHNIDALRIYVLLCEYILTEQHWKCAVNHFCLYWWAVWRALADLIWLQGCKVLHHCLVSYVRMKRAWLSKISRGIMNTIRLARCEILYTKNYICRR